LQQAALFDIHAAHRITTLRVSENADALVASGDDRQFYHRFQRGAC
jgi:hypothetical protein